ncbi:MAG: galactose mutarotase, partial [Gillisia sp.]
MTTSGPAPEKLHLHTLTNKNGIILKILNFGATIYSLEIPDKDGKLRNVVVTPKHLKDFTSEEYLEQNPCFGASVGRYAGRITEGKFLLNGKLYQLYEKNGVHLHGGFRGFQYRLWKVIETNSDTNSISLSYFSEDGEEDYPGNLAVTVTYTLTEENELQIS